MQPGVTRGAGARGSADGLHELPPRTGGDAHRRVRATASSNSSTRASICDRRRTVPPGCAQDFERALWVLAAVAVLVLLIACANVASLLVARATSREREMALRMSIGAGRGRLIQQMLIESALLSLASCALGALLARSRHRASSRCFPLRAPSSVSTCRWTGVCSLFLAVAGSLVTFLFGLAPALRASAVSPNEALKSGSGRHTAKVGLFRPLVAAQTAFGFVVLFVAGLVPDQFRKAGSDRSWLRSEQSGDRERRGQRAGAGRHEGACNRGKQCWSAFARSPESSQPACRASACSKAPDGTRACGSPAGRWMTTIRGICKSRRVFWRRCASRCVEGRDFEWRDARPELPSAVIVNESFARRYFPGESALGQRFFRVDGGADAGRPGHHRRRRQTRSTPVFARQHRRLSTTPSDRRRCWPRFRCGRDSKRALWPRRFGTSCREYIRLSA